MRLLWFTGKYHSKAVFSGDNFQNRLAPGYVVTA